MALMSDAAMVLFCDVADDAEEHDDWHTYEHMHERLSIEGFLRGTRWVRADGSGPRYLILYEVSSVDVAGSPGYLARLNAPTPWTTATMGRLRGMVRSFCRVTTSAGYGLGRAACAMRFAIQEGREESASAWLAREMQSVASWRGLASAIALEPVGRPPMTREQAIRGADMALDQLLLVTGYDVARLRLACAHHFGTDAVEREGLVISDEGFYDLRFTATAAEVTRTPARPALEPSVRARDGPRA